MEHIPCCSTPQLDWGLLPVTRLASRKILIEQNFKRLTGPAPKSYVENWPNTTSAWAGWRRLDSPADRSDGVHSLLLCTTITLGSSTCH
jgi:hypothetical protein